MAMFRCATRTTFTGDANRCLDLLWLARHDELKAHRWGRALDTVP